MTREEIVNSMSLQDAIQVFKDTNTYGTMDIAKSVILKALGEMPQWIPVSEIEDIKSEINELSELNHIDPTYEDCKTDVLEIIDRHTSGAKMGGEQNE